MKKRTLTALVIFLICSCAFLLREFVSPIIFDLFILAVIIASTVELCICYKSDKKVTAFRIAFSVTFSAILYGSFLAMVFANMPLYFIAMILFALFLVFALIVGIASLCMKKVWNLDNASVIRLLRSTIFCMTYPALLLGSFYFINHLNVFNSDLPKRLGLMLIITTFGISSFTDVFAMFGGMLLKGPKLCPKISPKKTISGAIVGLLFGAGSAIASFFIFNCFSVFNTLFVNFQISWWMFLIIGFVGSIMGQLGDLFESYFKRRLQIKDTGTVMPGHGGFMDRLDSVCFVVVVVLIASVILFI